MPPPNPKNAARKWPTSSRTSPSNAAFGQWLPAIGSIAATPIAATVRTGRCCKSANSTTTFLIDNVFGVVTKRSRFVKKFLDEINYLRLLPPELSILFPRVVGYSSDHDNPWLSMEYYGYPSLAEVFVFENVDPAIWEQVFVHLRQIVVQGFMQKRYPVDRVSALEAMYLEKTQPGMTVSRAWKNRPT